MNLPVLQMDYKSDMSSTAELHFCAQYWIYLEDDLLRALGDVTDEREERPEKKLLLESSVSSKDTCWPSIDILANT